MKLKRAYIEITNQCNLRCTFCIPHQRTYQFMSLNQFKKVVDEIYPLTSFLYLHVHGEPLLHPELHDFLDYCDQKECQIQLVTNGSLLDSHKWILNHPSVRKISISLHSANCQTQSTDQFVNSINYFIKHIEDQPNRYLELRFWTAPLPKTKAAVILDELQKTYSFQKTKLDNQFKISKQVFLHFDQEFQWPSSSNNSKQVGTCLGGKTMLAVLVDGTVTPCCLDCRGEISFGNLFTDSINSIMQSSRFLEFRKSQNENKFSEPLCQQCTYRNRFD